MSTADCPRIRALAILLGAAVMVANHGCGRTDLGAPEAEGEESGTLDGNAGQGGASGPKPSASSGGPSANAGHSGGASSSEWRPGSTSGAAGSGGAGGIPTVWSSSSSSSGGAVGGTSASSGVCSEAPCLAALFVPCQTSGSCTSESNTTAGTNQSITSCYANGVKQQITARVEGSTLSARIVQKRNSTECFSIQAKMSQTGDTFSYVFYDDNGRQVATGTGSSASEKVTVTCKGGAPVALSQSCMDLVGGSDNCSTGRCSY